MSSKETRLFVWSGATVGGSGLLWSFPILNVLSSVAAIAGLILIITRLGYFRAILVSLAAILLAVLSGFGIKGIEYGVISAIVFVVAVIAPGIAMGIAARGFGSPKKTILFGCIPILVLIAMFLVFYSEMAATTADIIRSFNATMVTYIDENPSLSAMLTQRYGTDVDGREKFVEEADKLITFFVSVLPGIMIFSFLAIVIISLMLAGRMASSLGIMIPQLRPFYLWRASEWWLLPTVIGLAMALFGGGDFGRYLGGNTLIVTGHIYAFAGLAYVESFFRRISAPILIRIAVYILLLLGSLPSMAFLAILGLLDSRFNFRRENAETGENNIE